MRHICIFIIAIMTSCGLYVKAQPSDVKNTSESIFKIITYKADGTVNAEGFGVFVSNDGTAISTSTPFIGASRATITDVKGRQAEVSRMLGADELYDIVKFKVNGIKAVPMEIATSPAKKGETVWLVTYGGKKEAKVIGATVKNVETFMDKYSYYIFNIQAPENSTSCPIVNSEGRMIGLMKPSSTSTDMHATDANFAMSLTTSGFALSDPTLRQIGIPPALPKGKEQAQLTLIMAEQEKDSIKQPAIIHDFIAEYPTLIDGYTALARLQVSQDDFDGAAKTMEDAIKNVDKKDEAHAGYGKIIYDKILYKSEKPYQPWTIDKAAEETDKAYTINKLPTYLHQQAQITYTKGNYQKAYDTFMGLLNTSMRNPELFYEAAQCKVMLKSPQQEIIALLDSAINNTDTLRMREAAPYFLARAEVYNATDSFRQAVFDYTRYEILMGGRLDASFYQKRGQVEIKAKLYQQALADMAAAIIIAPKEPTYYAEMASLQLKVNLLDDAIDTANRCIKLAPEYSDGYLILGLAQIGKGNRTEGITNLEKAQQLGNPQAQPLIEKYSK